MQKQWLLLFVGTLLIVNSKYLFSKEKESIGRQEKSQAAQIVRSETDETAEQIASKEHSDNNDEELDEEQFDDEPRNVSSATAEPSDQEEPTEELIDDDEDDDDGIKGPTTIEITDSSIPLPQVIEENEPQQKIVPQKEETITTNKVAIKADTENKKTVQEPKIEKKEPEKLSIKTAEPTATPQQPAAQPAALEQPLITLLEEASTDTQVASTIKQKIMSIAGHLKTRFGDKGTTGQGAIMQDINKLRGIFIRNLLLPKPPLAFSFSGYIKQDTWFDSYQVDGLRQDQYLLFPDIPLYDQCGRNINKNGRFNMVDIETRARAEIVGPKIFGAYPFGAIEVDFEGGVLDLIGLTRMRHAFIYLEWPRTSLLIGQYWHPVFITDCYPDTISYNNGAPIEPYAREPQIRITSYFDNITLTFAATSYSNAIIDRPNPAFTQLNIPFSNFTERNALLPDLNFQMRADIRDHFIGIGFNMRRLVPRLFATPATSFNLAVNESLISFLGLAYAKLNWDKFSIALKIVFAQNGIVFDMISGYAASCQNSITKSNNWTNLQCASAWTDIVWKGKVEPGLCLGITKNVGAGTTIIPSTAWALTENRQLIDYVARIVPRVRWYVDPLILGGEFEITRAGWGTLNERGRINNVNPVTNYRALFAAYFCF